MDKLAPSDVPIHDLIARRWSPRAFDPDRQVEPGTLRVLFEAARWAPSCFNEQPWRYLVFDGRDVEALEKARACLMDGNAWAKQAPVLIISVASEKFTRNGKVNKHGRHDLGLATENLVLQATALGLVTHQMGGFDPDRARESFSVPEDFTPLVMTALGYPGPADTLSPELQERENAPRVRRPLGEVMFGGGWEEPFAF